MSDDRITATGGWCAPMGEMYDIHRSPPWWRKVAIRVLLGKRACWWRHDPTLMLPEFKAQRGGVKYERSDNEGS